MSELKLSHQLVSELSAVVKTHDDKADDPGVTSQYLCAVVGFLLGQQDMPIEQKTKLVDELAAFMQHVVNDVSKQQQTATVPPPPPPQQDAFGIWKPKS